MKAPQYKGGDYSHEDPGKVARTAEAIARRDADRETAQAPAAKLPEAPVKAALAWLDRAWQWPLDREKLVRGVVAAYQEAANAKR